MRDRLAIWILVPCLWLAWPSPTLVVAQEEPAAAQPAAPEGDPAAAQPADAETPAAEGGAEGAEAAPAPAPAPARDKWNDAHSILRMKNSMVAWWKLAFLWLLFLMWVKSADWVNRDSQLFHLGYGKWNPIIFFPFFVLLCAVAFPILLPVPMMFLVAAILLPIVYLATFVPYVVAHNRVSELHQKVFTPDWFRFVVAQIAGKVGIKIEAERKAEYEKGAQVDLMAIAAKEERDNQANLITARHSPGYILVKELIAEMADRRADKSILDYTQQSVVIRQLIDGVWHNSEARDRESSDVMLAVMKTLANMNAAERRKKQESKFGAKYKDHAYVCPIVTQGVSTGERVVLELLGGYQRSFKQFADLGMRSKLAEQWVALMGTDKGLLVISAMPEGGLTTLTDVSLMESDRLLRDFIALEDEHRRERELENIDVATYDTKKGQTAASIIPQVIRKYPNVYIIRDFSDIEAAKLLLGEVRDEERLVITSVPAKNAPEALLRMLQMKVPQKEFASVVTAVLCTRLIRKLCDSCKVGYAPTPDLLKKLGIPAGKVEALYRVPKPEEIEKPCQECGGIGFKGRTGLFELLVVDDTVREVLVKQPKLDILRKAAQQAGMRSLQEEGLLLVAKGVTSLAELQRVLKE